MNSKAFNLLAGVKDLWLKSYSTFLTLLKLMLPISIIIRLLNQYGLIEVLSNWFDPILELVGLPGVFALVFIASAISNLYTALITFIAIYEPNLFTVAEVSQLGLMILIVHNLPIELAVAHKAGVHFFRAFILRFALAFLSGYLVYLFCSSLDLYQNQAVLTWSADGVAISKDLSWDLWAVEELKNYLSIFMIIFLVMVLLKITELIDLKYWMEKTLANLLEHIGIASKSISLVIVGISIGIAYGGGLIIKEAETHQMSRQDVFFAISLLSLFHAVIEDTILILIMGADITIVLGFRILITLITLYSLCNLSKLAKKNNWNKTHRVVFGY